MVYMFSFQKMELSVPKKMTRGDSQEEKGTLRMAIQSKCDT